jgi:hypothetical protein
MMMKNRPIPHSGDIDQYIKTRRGWNGESTNSHDKPCASLSFSTLIKVKQFLRIDDVIIFSQHSFLLHKSKKPISKHQIAVNYTIILYSSCLYDYN